MLFLPSDTELLLWHAQRRGPVTQAELIRLVGGRASWVEICYTTPRIDRAITRGLLEVLTDDTGHRLGRRLQITEAGRAKLEVLRARRRARNFPEATVNAEGAAG